MMRDPESATFRNLATTDAGTCGEINAKNGFGAYTGFQRFYYSRLLKKAYLDPAYIVSREKIEYAERDCKALKIIRDIEQKSKYAEYYSDRSDEIASACKKAAQLQFDNVVQQQFEEGLARTCPPARR